MSERTSVILLLTVLRHPMKPKLKRGRGASAGAGVTLRLLAQARLEVAAARGDSCG